MAGTRAAQRRATQAALITVARQRFASEGYSAVRLSDVVDALGMTKGALYHQFAGKKDRSVHLAHEQWFRDSSVPQGWYSIPLLTSLYSKCVPSFLALAHRVRNLRASDRTDS